MPRSADQIIDAVAAAITSQTKLLFFSHVYSATGLVTPAKELCELARRRGILSVVDGAHAPAMIPLNVDDVDADFYAGNLHKWMLAPLGAGFLVLGSESLDRLEPLHVSWGYRRADGDPDAADEFGSTPRLRALEFEGSRDVCPWLVVPEAIDFQSGLGFDAIRGRVADLASSTRQLLDGRAGLRLTTPTGPSMHGAMTAFWMSTTRPAEEVRQRLWAKRIELLVNDWCDGRTIRVSTHFYTTEAELNRIAEVAPKVFG
jgi:isopenicillin-N epimerase